MRSLRWEVPATMAARFSGVGVVVLLNVVLARSLGPEGIGAFLLAYGLLNLASTFALSGMDNAAVKQVASAVASNAPADGNQVSMIALVHVCGVSSVILLSLQLANPLLVTIWPDAWSVVSRMSFAVVPTAGLYIGANLLRARGRVIEFQWFRGAVLPGAILLTTLTWSAFRQITLDIAVGSVVLGASVSFALVLWRGRTTFAAVFSQQPRIANRKAWQDLWEVGRPLWVVAVAGLATGWLDTFAMGAFADPDELGVYAVAARTAVLLNMAFLVVNSVVSPRIATDFASRRLDLIAHTARHATLLMLAIAAPLFIAFILTPGLVLGVYGPEYVSGGAVLSILAIGQLFNACTGCVGAILAMGDQQRMLSRIYLVGFALALVLNVALVPRFGAIGAASATTGAVVAQNIFMSVAVWRRYRITIVPFTYRNAL